jgi:hypothetical protein
MLTGRILCARIAWLLLVGHAAASAQILPQATAQIVVESSTGAAVSLDEKPAGVVPATGSLTITGVSPGPHRVKVTLNGKHDFEQRLVASAGEVKRIRAALADEVGNLELYTTPDATVEIDGRKVGAADHEGRLLIRDLKAGRRNLSVQEEGYNGLKDEVQIRSGETLTITLNLESVVRPQAAPGAPPSFVQVRTLLGFKNNNVGPVTFTSDSKWVIAGNNSGDSSMIRIWETATGREVRALYDNRDTISDILCVPDLTRCVSQHIQFSVRTLRVWDPKTGKELLHFKDGEGNQISLKWISPDGKRLLASEDSTERIQSTMMVDTSTGKNLFKVEGEGAAMNPEGTVFVTAGDPIQFWDAATGKEAPAPITVSGESPEFSPDGHWLALKSKDQWQAWEMATGRAGPRFESDKYPYSSVLFSLDGRLLITNGGDVVVWDFATAEPIQKFGSNGRAAISPDGQWIAVGGYMTVELWQRQAVTR